MRTQTLHKRNFLLHLQKRDEYDQPILLKEPALKVPSQSHLDQMHNEYAITSQLADVEGVRKVYALEGTESRPVLLMEYIGGQSLSRLIKSASLELEEKLRLALNLTIVLGRIHEQQVMHKDISSGNILVTEKEKPGSQSGVYVIDFGLASIMSHENPMRLALDDSFAGALAYISPEQTGRMNRQVDYRTDLYSLGITLYELFTGQLPFTGKDGLEMVHAHMAQQPEVPHKIDAGIPVQISGIILKLLSKSAEDRYQTARGLELDLETCLDQWEGQRRIETFPLGQNDFTGRLHIPVKLYGRQAEIQQLQNLLDKACSEYAQFLLVAGYSGVGKTSLVREIQRDVIARGGTYIEGKFDQLQRILPYSGWGHAFTQLVENWLGYSEAILSGWRETILKVVGDQGQVLIDIIPSLERILGPQPAVPELGGVENQNRIHHVFNLFISCLSSDEHPLVIFLDDLQWIDTGSLDFIENLVTSQVQSRLLVIGAYRSNEVTASHPLQLSLDKMRAVNSQVTIMELKDLEPDDTNHLLADSLRLSIADCMDLGKVLVNKSSGNPFFYRQLLREIEAEGDLRFDRDQRRWTWDSSLDQKVHAVGSVVDLMIKTIRALPSNTQRTLSIAACIGSQFEISVLSTTIGKPETDILATLNLALKGGLIARSNGYFVFTHDRIQEAGYALIPESDRQRLHLKIGGKLLENFEAGDLDEEIFSIVGHLNQGRSLIKSVSEKNHLAQLNLRAGKRAKAGGTFPDAKKYIQIGLELLEADPWESQYELTLSLHNENGELACLTGQFDQVSATAKLINANAKRFLDRVRIHMARIEAETINYNPSQALQIGIDALEELGLTIPEQPSLEDYQSLKSELFELLSSKSGENWADVQKMSDETALAKSSLLASIMSTSYIANPALFPVITYHGAILTLRLGMDVWSPFFLGSVGLIDISFIELGTSADDAAELIQFCRPLMEIVEKMLENPITARSESKALLMLTFVKPWIGPLEEGMKFANKTYLSGYKSGDSLYGSYGAQQYAMQAINSGMNLVDYQNQISDYLYNLEKGGHVLTPQYLAMQLQCAENLCKNFEKPHKLKGSYFDEDKWLPTALKSGDTPGRHFLSINNLVLAYHFDMDEKLDEYTREAVEWLAGGRSQFTIPVFWLYYTLSLIRLKNLGADDRTKNMNLIAEYLRLLEIWVKSVPSTFQHKYNLILAERARVTGDLEGALTHYEEAIRGARKSGFTHEEALANELYARFWQERDNDRFAILFMREAHSLYLKWGAKAKAEHLARRYPNLLISEAITDDEISTHSSSTKVVGELDLHTVLKASEEITSEIALEKLMTRLMEIIIENAGAQKGFLIFRKGKKWLIEASKDVEAKELRVMLSQDIESCDQLSRGVINYVINSLDTAVIDDVSSDSRFLQDPYVQEKQPRSMLCIPLVHQGIFDTILYLENNSATGVFTPQRVELLQVLSTQIVMVLTNSRLFYDLELSEEKFRGVFESMIDVFIRANMDGTCLLVSPSIHDLLGYTQEEMLGQNLKDFYVDPSLREKMIEELIETKKPGNYLGEVIRKDGRHITISMNSKVVFGENSEPVAVEANFRDITAAKKAEEDLKSSEKRFRATFEQAAVGIAHVSPDGRFLRINEKFCEIVGYTHHQMLIRTFQDITHPDDLETDEEHVARLLQGKSDTYSMEKRYITQKNNIVWVNLTVSLLRNEDGTPNYFVAVVEDITNRKGTEQKILEYQDRLKDLTKELTITEEKVRKQIAIDLHDHVGQMLASAHMQLSSITQEKDNNELANKVENISATLSEAIQSTREAISNLSPPELNEIGLFAAVHDFMKEQIEAKHGIKSNLSGEEIKGMLDENTRLLLFRSLRELMINVVKHAQASHLDVHFEKNGGNLKITVSDDGVGFLYNPDLLRLKSNRYGLFSIQERILDLGGIMEVESEFDIGTTIELTVPLN